MIEDSSRGINPYAVSIAVNSVRYMWSTMCSATRGLHTNHGDGFSGSDKFYEMSLDRDNKNKGRFSRYSLTFAS